MKIELKPCPFCGGEAHFKNDTTGNSSDDWSISELIYVECYSCHARTMAAYNGYKPYPIKDYYTEHERFIGKMQDDLVDSGKREVARLWNERVKYES